MSSKDGVDRNSPENHRDDAADKNHEEPENDGKKNEQEEVLLQPNYYRIGMGPKGRGLFAIQDIQPRTLLHVAPCIRVSKEEYEKHMCHTILEHYLFNDAGGNKLLALGDGSLFNHSNHPNVDYRVDSEHLCIRYMTGHQFIKKGDELCISYGANLWFDNADNDDSGDDSNPSSDDSLQNGMASFLSRMEL